MDSIIADEMNSIQKAERQHGSDPAYLQQQYGTAERLRIRQEAHRLYSENATPWQEWVLGCIDSQAGDLLLDVGCGPGIYHARLAALGVRTIGLDASYGMLSEAALQTNSEPQSAWLLQAGAAALPLVDGAADCVLAAHMLYHVADQRTALREMRRVLKPGGRVCVVTNHADSGRRLLELHQAAARRLGYEPLANAAQTFSSNHGARVASVFPGAQSHDYVDALCFPTTDAALRYYGSAMIDAIADRPADAGHRPRLLAEMGRRIDAIIAQEGFLRVPKGVTCFTAVKHAAEAGS